MQLPGDFLFFSCKSKHFQVVLKRKNLTQKPSGKSFREMCMKVNETRGMRQYYYICFTLILMFEIFDLWLQKLVELNSCSLINQETYHVFMNGLQSTSPVTLQQTAQWSSVSVCLLVATVSNKCLQLIISAERGFSQKQRPRCQF